MAKLKPEIENLCQQHQFKYYVEENEGRILVKFGQGTGQLSQTEAVSFWDSRPNFGAQHGYPGSSQEQPQQSYQQTYQGQPQYQSQGGQDNNDVVEEVIKKATPIIFRKLGQCCSIM